MRGCAQGRASNDSDCARRFYGDEAVKGSHATYGDYPRVCHGCGEKTRITKERLWFEYADGQYLTWHVDCRLKNIRPYTVPCR